MVPEPELRIALFPPNILLLPFTADTLIPAKPSDCMPLSSPEIKLPKPFASVPFAVTFIPSWAFAASSIYSPSSKPEIWLYEPVTLTLPLPSTRIPSPWFPSDEVCCAKPPFIIFATSAFIVIIWDPLWSIPLLPAIILLFPVSEVKVISPLEPLETKIPSPRWDFALISIFWFALNVIDPLFSLLTLIPSPFSSELSPFTSIVKLPSALKLISFPSSSLEIIPWACSPASKAKFPSPFSSSWTTFIFISSLVPSIAGSVFFVGEISKSP